MIKRTSKFDAFDHGICVCPYCRLPMESPWTTGPGLRRMSKDHIMPREWGGITLGRIANNVRWVCQECNNWRAACGHCVGALACVRDVAQDTGVPVRNVLRAWRMAAIMAWIKVKGRYPTSRARFRMRNATHRVLGE